MTTAAQVVAAARAVIGTPFLHRGRSAAGMDCAGLLIAVAQALRLPHPGALYYEPLPQCGLITMLLAEYCTPISEPELGGVLHLVHAGRPQHLGIVGNYPAGGFSLIHAAGNVGRVVEQRLDDRTLRRIVSCWRLGGVA